MIDSKSKGMIQPITGEDRTGIFELEVSEDDQYVAYLKLPTYPRKTQFRVSKTIRLVDYIGGYKGPDIMLDFDEAEVLIGIEILAD